MRVLRYSAFIVALVVCALSLPGQQVPKDQPAPFYFVALTDPACPVTGCTAPAPVTKEIRVLYFPMGINGIFKGGFDGPPSLSLPSRCRRI
jgi:hypothetical protein